MAEADHVRSTRAAYDASADLYAQLVGTELGAATEGPLDMAVLATFVELVAGHPANRVLDAGCGPGRVAAFLAARGLDVVGVDVSRAMLTAARRAHPGIPFGEGLLTALPVADGSLAGVVCWYSVIHTPPEHLAAVCAELVRVLAPLGRLLVAFQAGDGDPVHRAETHGRRMSLTRFRHAPDHVVQCLSEVGLHVHARAVRDPELAHESEPQAFLFARAPGS